LHTDTIARRFLPIGAATAVSGNDRMSPAKIRKTVPLAL